MAHVRKILTPRHQTNHTSDPKDTSMLPTLPDELTRETDGITGSAARLAAATERYTDNIQMRNGRMGAEQLQRRFIVHSGRRASKYCRTKGIVFTCLLLICSY